MRLDALVMGIVAALVQTFRKRLWETLTERADLVLAVGLIGIGVAIVFFKSQMPNFWPTIFGCPSYP